MDANFTKHHLLEYINPDIVTEKEVNPHRIFEINKKPDSENNEKVIYFMTREFRVEDNFALNFAKSKNKDFKVIIYYDKDFDSIKPKLDFLMKNIEVLKMNLKKNKINYEFVFENKNTLEKLLKKENPSLLITDFYPLFLDFFKQDFGFKIIEVDSRNITPARFASETQAYNAASLRRKLYRKIFEFLTKFPETDYVKGDAYQKLDDFIKVKLDSYAKYKNNPDAAAVSELSRYINYGFISAQRIAIEVIKSDNSDENKEIFLEELVVRKELSDNFCLYNREYKSFNSLPNWAKDSLNMHKNDLRIHLYSLSELETAKTQDPLWNASQNQLLREGRIHGYMRMYWAKMILQWTKSAQEAIDFAIYLNDKYAFDAPSENGYVGILWSIGGLHDRPFQDFPVSGKIRRMTYNGAKSKFDVKKYIDKYS